MRCLSVLLLITLMSSTAFGQSWQDVVVKVQAGKTVKIGILGNSIGCGQTANGFDTNTMLESSYAAAITGTSAASMLTSFGPRTPVEGWANQLYAYLQAHNASSEVVNLSGSGWDTGDQLGVPSGNSGKLPVHDNVSTFVAMTPVPDAVLLPLQINDWGHNQGVNFFNANTAAIISRLEAAGIVPVMIIESPVYNRPETNPSDAYTADRSRYPNDYNFVEAARSIATKGNLAVIDFFTPIHTQILLNSGTYYGDKMCNAGLFADGCPCGGGGNNCPVHPNQAGHDMMAAAAISFFQQKMPPSPVTVTAGAPLKHAQAVPAVASTRRQPDSVRD